jgi:hypothetical protein
MLDFMSSLLVAQPLKHHARHDIHTGTPIN